MVVSSLRARAKAVDLDWKTNLNAYSVSALPNNSNASGQGQGAAIHGFDIQHVGGPGESSCMKDSSSNDHSK